jgi:DNA modification methylase
VKVIEINNIYNMDCINGMSQLQDNSVDLIVTSPPYYNAKEYSHWNTYDDYMKFLREVFTLALSKLKENRMCCVNLSVIIQPREKRSEESKRIALPFHFVNLMENIGYQFLEDIIWVKPEGAAKNRNGRFYQDRQPVQYKPNIVNEYILVFKKPSKYLIDKIVRSYTGDIKQQSLVNEEYERSNVWFINPETKSKHPAPYPKELSDKLIRYYSYVDDLVLDMFMGSGTTAISSKELHRNYIGFELNNTYFISAVERIKSA